MKQLFFLLLFFVNGCLLFGQADDCDTVINGIHFTQAGISGYGEKYFTNGKTGKQYQCITYYRNGNVQRFVNRKIIFEYYENGKVKHSANGKKYTDYYQNGTKKEEGKMGKKLETTLSKKKRGQYANIFCLYPTQKGKISSYDTTGKLVRIDKWRRGCDRKYIMWDENEKKYSKRIKGRCGFRILGIRINLKKSRKFPVK